MNAFTNPALRTVNKCSVLTVCTYVHFVLLIFFFWFQSETWAWSSTSWPQIGGWNGRQVCVKKKRENNRYHWHHIPVYMTSLSLSSIHPVSLSGDHVQWWHRQRSTIQPRHVHSGCHDATTQTEIQQANWRSHSISFFSPVNSFVSWSPYFQFPIPHMHTHKQFCLVYR